MAKKEYKDLFKDPRWQKRRLEIMKRDNFSCVSCQDNQSTLNVHHCVPYKKGALPWEYDDEELITLCENCHEHLSAIIKDCNNIVMSNCKYIHTARPFSNILCSIDDMSPYQMEAISNIIQSILKF